MCLKSCGDDEKVCLKAVSARMMKMLFRDAVISLSDGLSI